jgi:hypothetical protein
VDLWFIHQGFFQPKLTFCFSADGRAVSLDRRLREILTEATFATGTRQRLADDLALLRRWYYSSWRVGEIVLFDRLDRVPYRKIVNAISRLGASRDDPAARGATGNSPGGSQ